MIERGKISGLQMAILIYPTIIATAILLVPAITGKHALQDMWLSPIWGSLTGYFTLFITYQLHKYYPNETSVQFGGKIIGKIPGKIMGIILLLVLWQEAGLIVREYDEFVIGNFLPQTPMIVVAGGMMFVCAMAVHGGLEVMARSAQVFVPITVLLFLLIDILLIPDLDTKNILPMLENGLTPSLKGAIVPASWFNLFFLLTFILPYLGKKEKGLKWGIIAVIAVTITMVMSNLFSLLLFGNMTSTFTYPFFSAARYISLADFLQHIESIVMAIWVAGIFVKVSVFLYVVTIGTAQLLHLSDYRPIIFPIAFLIIISSYWSASNLQQLSYYVSTTWIIITFIVYTLFPALLLLIAIIRKKFGRDSE